MTSLLDVVTSESPEVNTDISFNITVAATSTKGLARRASPTAPFLAMVAILFTMAIINLCGNGFTLITIRKTPRLWTKTNFILTSMLLAHFISGVSMFWYNPYILLVNVFNNPCRSNVVITVLSSLIKATSYVSNHHTILIAVERYIAIVHPFHYETMFTDCKLKFGISVIWSTAIFMGMSYMLWLINADLSKCTLIPADYKLIDAIFFIPMCIFLIACYGKILAISWHQSQRTEPQPANANPAPGSLRQTTTLTNTTQSSKANTKIVDANERPMTNAGAYPLPAGAASSELTREQQRQKIKSRRREFKAVYLTAAIVGTFVILWSPLILSRVLEAVGYNPVVTSYIRRVGGALGTFNYATTWVIYAAVSRRYRRAYQQMLIRFGCCCCKNITPPTDNSLII